MYVTSNHMTFEIIATENVLEVFNTNLNLDMLVNSHLYTYIHIYLLGRGKQATKNFAQL